MQPKQNPYILPGALATFVAGTVGDSESLPPPPTINATWATFAAALGVSAPLSYKTANAAIPAIRGMR